jgi:hypothetical protein
MSATVVLLRFAFGALAALVLVAVLAFAGVASLWLSVGLPVAIGTLSVAFGDRFLTSFLRLFRWLS